MTTNIPVYEFGYSPDGPARGVITGCDSMQGAAEWLSRDHGEVWLRRRGNAEWHYFRFSGGFQPETVKGTASVYTLTDRAVEGGAA